MKELYSKIRSRMDGDDLVRRTTELCKIEMGQTFRHYRMAAEHIFAELKKYNIPNAEILSYPADGVTTYQDKRMPIAWDATVGKLTLCDADNTVAADYTRHPFHLIKGSCATQPGGETVRIITEQQFLAGEDPKGALVMLESDTWPRSKVLTPILDLGGRGIISDFLTVRYDDVDAIQWVTACTEGSNWHVQSEDREFIGFSVSLRIGNMIRQRANHGALKARIECDGRRYKGELPAVTALIPGKRKEEVWLLAHAYEPLLNDDSNGIVAAIETARQVMAEGTPEYSLRLVFAMELYGFAAFHATFKGKVIGACNFDSLPASAGHYCRVIPPITTIPFHGIDIMHEIAKGFEGTPETRLEPPRGFDDMFLSDSTTAVPTGWFMCGSDGAKYWHNTQQTKEGFLSPEVFADYTALAALWTFKTVFYTGAPAVLPELVLKKQETPWRKYASQQVFRRKEIGLPQDLIRIPKAERRALPDGVIYGPFQIVLSRMDGVKDLEQIIMEAEAEYQTVITDGQIRKYINALNYLTEWGYIEVVKRTALTREMLTEALKAVGIKENDVLLVHASISKCGYFEGGAEAMINGIYDAVGKDGAALFTAFTRPYIYLGGLNRGWNYRPYDPNDLSQIWTGGISKV